MWIKGYGKLIVSFGAFLLLQLPAAALAIPVLGINDVSVSEGTGGSGVAIFEVIRTSTEVSSTVQFTTSAGTATEGTGSCGGTTDYLRMSGSLLFNVGERSKSIMVTICGDNRDENDETFMVYLTSPTGATIADDHGQGTIIDDDPPPVIDVSSLLRPEGNSGQSTWTYSVFLSPASGREISVNYSTSNVTATGGSSCSAGVDFVNTSGTLRFAPGEASKPVNVTVCGDTWSEPDERFNVVLSNAVNATIQGTPSSGGGIISNDEPQIPVLSVRDVSASEPVDRIGVLYGSLTFTLELSSGNHSGCSIDYVCSRVTATPTLKVGICYQGDYECSSGTIQFQPGERSKTISAKICPDRTDEPNETFELRLSTPRGMAAPDLVAVGTIVDND